MNLNEKWFYMKNYETAGPFSLSDIRDLIQHGEIRAMDSVFHDSLGQWTPAGKAAALQSFFGAAPVAVPPQRRSVSQSPSSPDAYSSLNGASGSSSGATVSVSSSDRYPIPGPPPLKTGAGSAASFAGAGVNAGVAGTSGFRSETSGPKSSTMPLNSSLTPQVSIFVPPTTPVKTAHSGQTANAVPSAGSAMYGSGANAGDATDKKGEEEQGALFDVDQEENSDAVLSSFSSPVSAPGDSEEFKGLFDCLPNVFRSSFPVQFGNQIVRFFYDIGNWALLSGILLLIVQIVLETIQMKSFCFDRSGSLCCLLSLYAALRYVNCKLRAPIIRLNNLGEGYISSFAVPDALSVLFFIFGACGLVFFFSLGMAKLLPISIAVIFGFELFIVFAFAAVIAANPHGMKMSVNRNLSLSEDSVGIIQYFMKLGIRLCCGGYGIGCMSCCALILYIQYNLLFNKNPNELMFLYFTCLQYSLELLIFAAIPLVSYLFFLFMGCFLDFAQKVLQTGRRR